MTDRNKLIGKITKLLAHAEGTNNQAEADLFMSRVHKLLEEHNIALHELGDKDDPIHRSPDELEVSRSLSYCSSLVPWLGAYYGCEVTWQRTPKKFYFTVFGRQSATMTFHLMAPFVLKQVRQQATKLHKEGLAPTYGKALTAVANALTQRLTKLWYAEQQREQSRVASGERALVPVDQVKALVDETFGELNTSDFYPTKTTQAARKAAEDIGVHRQTDHTPQTLLEKSERT
jgi:hypothetical protein